MTNRLNSFHLKLNSAENFTQQKRRNIHFNMIVHQKL